MKRLLTLCLLLFVGFSYTNEKRRKQLSEEGLEYILKEETNPQVRDFMARRMLVCIAFHMFHELSIVYEANFKPHVRWYEQAKADLNTEGLDNELLEEIERKIKHNKAFWKRRSECIFALKKYVNPEWLKQFEADVKIYYKEIDINLESYPPQTEIAEEWLQQILEQQTDPRMQDLMARIGIIGLNTLKLAELYASSEYSKFDRHHYTSNSKERSWLQEKEEEHSLYFSYYEMNQAYIMHVAVNSCRSRRDACGAILQQYASPKWYRRFCDEQEVFYEKMKEKKGDFLDSLQNLLVYRPFVSISEYYPADYIWCAVYQELVARRALIELHYQDFKNCEGERAKEVAQAWLDKEIDSWCDFSIKGVKGKKVYSDASKRGDLEFNKGYLDVNYLQKKIPLICQGRQEECSSFFKRYVDPIWLAEFKDRRDALSKELGIKNTSKECDEKTT